MEIVCQSSGLQASSAVIVARPCLLHGLTLLQASAACTIIAYDNKTGASGVELEQLNNNTNTSTVNVVFTSPVACTNGIYVALTGTGAKFIVKYSLL